jgi:sister-chromatid-cohesion protein PDS5
VDSEQVVKVLQFNQQLLPKTGTPIEVDNLVAHRKALQREGQDLDQEGVDRASLATPANELASEILL